MKQLMLGLGDCTAVSLCGQKAKNEVDLPFPAKLEVLIVKFIALATKHSIALCAKQRVQLQGSRSAFGALSEHVALIPTNSRKEVTVSHCDELLPGVTRGHELPINRFALSALPHVPPRAGRGLRDLGRHFSSGLQNGGIETHVRLRGEHGGVLEVLTEDGEGELDVGLDIGRQDDAARLGQSRICNLGTWLPVTSIRGFAFLDVEEC